MHMSGLASDTTEQSNGISKAELWCSSKAPKLPQAFELYVS